MQIINHKLLVNPITFKWMLIEISYPPYKKREVDPKELCEWEEYRFRRQLEACGYSGFVDSYIKQEGVIFLKP